MIFVYDMLTLKLGMIHKEEFARSWAEDQLYLRIYFFADLAPID